MRLGVKRGTVITLDDFEPGDLILRQRDLPSTSVAAIDQTPELARAHIQQADDFATVWEPDALVTQQTRIVD